MEININNYLELKSKKLKRAEIAEQFGIPDWKLKKIIASNGWGKQLPTVENVSVFDGTNLQGSYWAGFIAADGNVDSKNRIRIMLQYSDIGHLEKFKKFIGSTHSISSNTEKYCRCSFEYTHVGMCADLANNYFIIPNKTSILEFPYHLTEDHLREYIRGYLDGDGTIYETISNKLSKRKSLGSGFASGSKQFIHDLYEYLNIILNLGGNIQDFENKSQLKYSPNDSVKLLSYLYANSKIYLDRKYDLYVKFVINKDFTKLDNGIVQTSTKVEE